MLKQFNALEALTTGEYQQHFPQPDEQSGSSRIDELANYHEAVKAIGLLRSKGAKPSQMLGRQAFKAVFPHLQIAFKKHATLEKELASLETAVEDFLDAVRCELSDKDSFMWSADPVGALSARALERKQRATEAKVNSGAEYLNEEDEDEDEEAEAVTAASSSSSVGGPL